MDRRSFVSAAVAAAAALPTAAGAAAADEEAAIRKRVADLYAAFSAGDVKRYRSFMMPDYLLLENGEIIDLEGDIAFFMDRPDGYKRTDSFDFRHVGIASDMAYAVYYVNAVASDPQTPPKTLRWLESIAFRKQGGEWRCSLIHSTVIAPVATVPVQTEKG